MTDQVPFIQSKPLIIPHQTRNIKIVMNDNPTQKILKIILEFLTYFT